MSKKGWVRKSTKDEYPTGGGPCQKGGGLGVSCRNANANVIRPEV